MTRITAIATKAPRNAAMRRPEQVCVVMEEQGKRGDHAGRPNCPIQGVSQV